MGERQFGPYRLVQQIAVGGMAEIHLAKTHGIAGFEKYVVLKMIHPNFSQDHQFIQMLIDEAKITVQLQHVNIAQTFDLGRVGENFYITMEYVDGADLYKLLRKSSELDRLFPIPLSAFIGKEVASGLDYAHRKRDHNGQPLRIVHRDVSPQNVLISYAGEVKLVDFGIAKATMRARQTAVGVIKGKYYYMSPEQAWGEELDQRTDIFSAGILLYEALTGQMLYLEDDLHKLLEKVRRADIPPPSTLRKEIPAQLDAIVMRALAKQPQDRYQTAGDLASDLERFLHTHAPVFTANKVASWMVEVLGQAASPTLLGLSERPEPERDRGETRRLTRDQLVMARSEFTDENSIIFALTGRPSGEDSAAQPGEGEVIDVDSLPEAPRDQVPAGLVRQAPVAAASAATTPGRTAAAAQEPVRVPGPEPLGAAGQEPARGRPDAGDWRREAETRRQRQQRRPGSGGSRPGEERRGDAARDGGDRRAEGGDRASADRREGGASRRTGDGRTGEGSSPRIPAVPPEVPQVARGASASSAAKAEAAERRGSPGAPLPRASERLPNPSTPPRARDEETRLLKDPVPPPRRSAAGSRPAGRADRGGAAGPAAFVPAPPPMIDEGAFDAPTEPFEIDGGAPSSDEATLISEGPNWWGPAEATEVGVDPFANANQPPPAIGEPDTEAPTQLKLPAMAGPPPASWEPAPALAAHVPQPAVSQLRPPRSSRRTPADGVPAVRPPARASGHRAASQPTESVLASLLSPAEPRAGAEVALSPATPLAEHARPPSPHAPSPLPSASSTTPPPPPLEPAARSSNPFGFPGNPPPMAPFGGHLANLGQLPAGQGGFSTRAIVAELERDEIPAQYRIGRGRQPAHWLIALLAIVLAAAVAAALLAIYGTGEEAPGDAVVHLISVPQGAKVTVDGQTLPEPTPTTIRAARGRRLVIGFELPRYQREELQFTVPEKVNQPQVVERLEPIVVKLTIESTPSGAEVFIGGNSVGRTPLELPGLDPQTATSIELRLKGHRPVRQTLDWSQKTEQRLVVPLTQ